MSYFLTIKKRFVKSDKLFFELIYKIGIFFGIFPMKQNNILKHIIPLYFFCFGILHTYLIIDEVCSKITGKIRLVDVPLVYIFTNVMALYVYFVNNLGTYLNSKNWTVFFKLLNRLDKSIKREKHGIFYWIKLNVLLIVYIMVTFKHVLLLNLPIWVYSVFHILCKLSFALLILVIWEISSLLCFKYKKITRLVALYYKNKIVIRTCRQNLINLHQLIMKFNDIFGKFIFGHFIFEFFTVFFLSYYILNSNNNELQVFETVSILTSLVSTHILVCATREDNDVHIAQG